MSADSQRCTAMCCRRHANDEHERDFHESFSALDSRRGDRCRSRNARHRLGAIRRRHAARQGAREHRRHREECRHRRDAPHAGERRRQLHAGRTSAGHLSRRRGPGHRNHGHADRRVHRDARSHRGQRRRRSARGADAGSDRDGPATQRSENLRSRHDGFATTDRNRAADDAQLPRVRRHRSRRGVRGRWQAAGPRSAAARKTRTA